MARPRTPTAALELKGAFQKDPQRKKARENEPTPAGPIGSPPDHLTDLSKKIWRRVAKSAYWLGESDREMLEMVSVLKAEFETNPTEMAAAKMALLGKLLNDLGLSATARTRVKAPEAKEPEVNPFASFN